MVRVRKRTKPVNFQLTPEDYEIFRRMCHSEYLPMAEIIRKLVKGWMDKKIKNGYVVDI